MKEIPISILNDTYKVIVCFGNDKDIRKTLNAWKYPTDFDLQANLIGRRGVTFNHKDCHPVIALPKKPKTPEEIGTLAHEAVHAIKHIFESIGEETVGEVFAHSVGAVVRGVLGAKYMVRKLRGKI